jgi:hypothetical protein
MRYRVVMLLHNAVFLPGIFSLDSKSKHRWRIVDRRSGAEGHVTISPSSILIVLVSKPPLHPKSAKSKSSMTAPNSPVFWVVVNGSQHGRHEGNSLLIQLL